MAILLSAYAGISALQIKNKASIPLQANMTVVGNDVSCVNIDSDQVGSVLGESDSSWSGLCHSANANPYSYFGPLGWGMGVNGLEPFVKTPYDLDYFAGYNHQAPPPGISVDDVSAVDSTHSFNFYCFVSFGEYDFRDASGATEVVCKVFDGATNIATFYQDISAADYLVGVVFSGAINNPSNHTNFSVIVYFAGAGHVKICDIPNVAPETFTVTITNASGGTQHGRFGGVSLSADWDTSDYAGAMLFEDNLACSVDSVFDIFTVKIRGIDTDGDGIADMTGITLDLYARKNDNPTLYYCGTIRPARANQVGPSGSLPFTIEDNDSVDFVIAAP